MGQSDTESTSSSMRGNPGSPRDPSTLFEEVSIDSFSSPFNHAAAGSPSTSSDSSEVEAVLIAGERPKSRQRDIPFIDLTSLDSNEPESPHEAGASNSNDGASDVHGMYSEFAVRVQRQLNAARERVARMRMEHNRIRTHAFRSRMQNCPYIVTYRDGRRHSSLARQRAIEMAAATPSAGSSSTSRSNVIMINDSPVANNSVQNNPPSSSDGPDGSEPMPDAGAETFENPYHQMRPEQRYAWRRRLSRDVFIQRIQDRYGSCVQGSSDEAIARRLQAQYDQELAEEQQQSSRGGGDSSYIPHASPELAAGPMPSPVHARRIVRRGLLRRHNVGPHFTPASGLPDLLLPFVSVTSLPPPLHHFGEPGQNQNNENEDYEVLWNLSERIGPAKSRGLSKEVIDRIPSFRYSTSSKDLSNGSCVVCMMDYTHREKLRKLPCNHDFHSKCIDRWLKSNRSCPICRETVCNS